MDKVISRENKAILEELIKISNLPINYNGYYLTFFRTPFDSIDGSYIYKNNAEVVIIKIEDDYVSLLHVKNNSILYLYSKTDGTELKVIREVENNSSYVNLTRETMRVVLSNSLTFEIKEMLKTYQIKYNIKVPANLEYTEFDFRLPPLIEEGNSVLDFCQYIPESELTVINGRDGRTYKTISEHGRKYYYEEKFKVLPTIIHANILPRFKESGREKVQHNAINPYVLESVLTSLIPMRAVQSNDLYKKIFTDEHNHELYRFYMRYFDDVVYAPIISKMKNLINSMFSKKT